MESRIVVSCEESVWCVALLGEHDLSTAPDLETELRQIRKHGTTVVIDLSGTTFADSSTVRAILYHAAQPGESTGIVAVPGTLPRRLLDLVDAGRHVTVCDSRDEALQLLSRESTRPDGTAVPRPGSATP